MKTPAGPHKAITAVEALVVLAVTVVLIFLISLLLPASLRPSTNPRVVCASNLRGLGQGMEVYSLDNAGQLPTFSVSLDSTFGGNGPPLRWRGRMGSQDGLRVSAPSAEGSTERAASPSRALFQLITQGYCVPGQFICAESADREDELRNFGPDARIMSGEKAAIPGRDRFDFNGFTTLSYGHDLGSMFAARRGRPTEKLDSRKVIMGDKGPYSKASADTLGGSRTTRDIDSALRIPASLRLMDDQHCVTCKRRNGHN